MAELSAKERYDNADLDAFSAYSNACSQHEEHVQQYNHCLEKHNELIDEHHSINSEIGEKVQTCKRAWEKIESGTDSVVSLNNVVVIGIYNQGKSTLLNALLDDMNNATFKVSNTPQTRELQCKEHGGIQWIDTPGFAVEEVDDNKALAGIEQVGIGLFVHKAKMGELHKNEIETLRKLADKHREAFLRTCIVLNDDIGEEENLKILHHKITEQLKTNFDVSIPVFICNPEDYQQGLRENDDDFKQISKISILRDWIKWRHETLKELGHNRIDQLAHLTSQASRLESEVCQKCKKAIEKLEKGIQYIEEQVQLAAICSENLHSAIKEIERNKDRMRGLRKEVISDEKVSGGLLGGGGGAAVGAAIGSIVPFFGTLTGAAIGAALGSTAGATSSDFDEEHNSNMEMHTNHISELNEKKNDIAESIRDFRAWQDDFRAGIQNMQEIYENWK